jgi:uncharacterized protein YcfL
MRTMVLTFALVACGPPDAEPQPPTQPLVLDQSMPSLQRAFVHARVPHSAARVRQSASVAPRSDGKTAQREAL